MTTAKHFSFFFLPRVQVVTRWSTHALHADGSRPALNSSKVFIFFSRAHFLRTDLQKNGALPEDVFSRSTDAFGLSSIFGNDNAAVVCFGIVFIVRAHAGEKKSN
jgi:hypothetical protein